MHTYTNVTPPLEISQTYTDPILVIHITYHIDLSTYTCAWPLRNHLLKLKLYESETEPVNLVKSVPYFLVFIATQISPVATKHQNNSFDYEKVYIY